MSLYPSRIAAIAVVILASVCVAGEVPDFPAKPFDLKEPVMTDHHYNDVDLKNVDAGELSAYASEFAYGGKLEDAVKLQYWAWKKTPNRGKYELACYYSMAGKIPEAVFMLQDVAVSEGVDHAWVLRDGDLQNVRESEYWDKLNAFIDKCNRKWEASGYKRVVVTKPSKGREVSCLVIGLHGYGSRPEDFGRAATYQRVADETGAVFAGVSATLPNGTYNFEWSEDPSVDYKHVEEALKDEGISEDRKGKKVILLGFSQGAQAAVELAARHPEKYAGAIAMCPGFWDGPKLKEIKKPKDLSSQIYIVVCGADESEENQQVAKGDAEWLEKHGAKVLYHAYSGLGHSFPPYYYEQLPLWIQFYTK